MSALLDEYRPKRDGVTIPTIAIWIVVSALLHVALLLWTPRLRTPSTEKPDPPPLTAYLRPIPQKTLPPAPPPIPPPPPPAPRQPAVRPPQPAAKPRPPVIALERPASPEKPASVPTFKMDTPPLAPIPPVTVAPPAEADLSAFIEARRRARGELPVDTEAERANRGALNSAALKPSPPITFESPKPPNGYGSFGIRRRGYDYAEYMFYGWNINFRRAGLELIEVRKGNNSDIDIAVVRSIIEVIRRTESGDFPWYSTRLGRTLTLSARARDNSGLEEFIYKEFYDDLHRYR